MTRRFFCRTTRCSGWFEGGDAEQAAAVCAGRHARVAGGGGPPVEVVVEAPVRARLVFQPVMAPSASFRF